MFSIFFVTLSDLIMGYITGNLANSSYFTFSLLFDAVGYEAKIPYIKPFSTLFYPFFGLLIIDGIVKVVIIGLLIATIIEIISSVNLKHRINIIAARRYKNHIIICGYSSFTDRLMKDLKSKNQRFVVLEKDQKYSDMLRGFGYVTVAGDFKRTLYLELASIKNASGVVIGTDDDFDNMLGLITIKKLNPNMRVIVRINNENSVTKMLRAGADLCIIPEILVGIDLGMTIIKNIRGS